MGKLSFTPNVDTGDHVIIINTDKVILTGKKLDKKFYTYHTGYIGGLKQIPYKTMMANKSDVVVFEAVKGMLPKNKLSRQLLDNLYVYEGGEHKHEAQSPKAIDINVLK